MTVEAGWYYAEGDPEGTVRRWNGEQWIGFPVRSPDEQSPRHVAGVKPFEPIPGQVNLEGIATATIVVLGAVMAAYGYLAYVIFQNDQFDPATPFDPEPTPIAFGVTVMAVGALLGGLVFIGWFSLAYRNLSKWHNARRATYWPSIVFFVPLVQFRWPWDMMLELVEKSARPEHQGKISPFNVLGWWVGWTFHQTLFWAALGLNRFTDFAGSTSHQLAMAACGVAIIGLFFGMRLVHAITAAQDTRRKPSEAQLAMMAA